MSDPTTPEAGPDATPDRMDAVIAEATEAQELHALSGLTCAEVRQFLDAVTEVASGTSPDVAVPVLLLATSQALLAGARLGAITDVVPPERFEPDNGPDVDVDPLRVSLANLFEGLDEYAEVVDPLTDGSVVRGTLSGDLADVVSDLAHGLQHFEAGRPLEALWWWQFSYVSNWGTRASSALRVLQSVLSHLRLDVEAEVVADAEFEALHSR